MKNAQAARLMDTYTSAPDAKARGLLLREWRVAARLSQAAAGKAVDLSEAMVCRIEKGDRVPRPIYVRALIATYVEAEVVDAAA